MTPVSSAWLDLREPFDAAARNDDITHHLAGYATSQSGRLAVLDAGTGTGANFRYLAPRLNCDQVWHLIDIDDTLLALVNDRVRQWAGERGWPVYGSGGVLSIEAHPHRWTLSRRQFDLTQDLDGLNLSRFHLVTASALADLVTEPWMNDFSMRCGAAGVAVAMVLTYDGRRIWTPTDPDDDAIVHWFNDHQRRETAKGRLLGPDAADVLTAQLNTLGFEVRSGRSDWNIGPENRDMHATMIDDADAPCKALHPDQLDRIMAWAARRQHLVDEGSSTLTVGHVDILALP